jgi:hypothetical protein
LEYFHDVTPPPEEEETVEDRWCSPGRLGPRSEEEDEEDNQYINDLPTGNLKARDDEPKPVRPLAEAGWYRQIRIARHLMKGQRERKRSTGEVSVTASHLQKRS